MLLADAVANPLLPPNPTPQTSPWDLSWLPDSLKTTDTLFIVASCWAVGYLSRWIPPGGLKPTWRPLVVTVTGMCMSFALVHPGIRAFGIGMINVCLSMVTYDQVFSRIEDSIKSFLAFRRLNASQQNP